ncbi:transcription initiation factor IIB 3, partial [Halogeometricum sp. CBA1124]|nr:transcription initiation factor IIB 3 [Halogeometricum sp. CBA1124]
MTRPTRQRERDSDRTRWQGEREEDAAEDEDDIDIEDMDEEDLVRTGDGELIHEPTGIVVEEEQIDPGPEWRA